MIYYVFHNQPSLELLVRLLIAGICGILLGFERTRHQKVAGIKTYFMVAIGAAIFTMVSKYGFLDAISVEGSRVDVARVACNIAPGVSFLCAGTISYRSDRVQGLATSAGIWSVAAIGIAIANGMYIVGIFATLLLIVIQTAFLNKSFGPFVIKVPGRLEVAMDAREESLQLLEELLSREKMEITGSNIRKRKDGGMTYSLFLRVPERVDVAKIVREIADIPSVKSVDM